MNERKLRLHFCRMGRSKKKRSRDEYEKDVVAPGSPPITGDPGVAGTLALLREPDGLQDDAHDDENRGQDWTDVMSKSKKRRKDRVSRDARAAQDKGKATARSDPEVRHGKKKWEKKTKGKDGNRPAVNVASLHKIHASVKISDLQALALYCLADGPSPQWISVRHHLQIKKVVVLMVPGLEKGMFTGEIELSEQGTEVAEYGNGQVKHGAGDDDAKDGTPSDGHHEMQSDEQDNESKAAASSSTVPPSAQLSTPRNPDSFLPSELVKSNLPSPLKPLANMFQHLWPVKCPGDDRYSKVHSPLHAMLNSPLTRSKEENAVKGPKAPTAGKDWVDRRTPITAYIASADDLRENNHVLHSLLLETEAEREMEALRRTEAGTGPEHGWVESQVKSLSDAQVPWNDIPSGSVTEGREILATDCEMVKVSDETYALARISIVSWDGSVVMDELVKPDLPITDYVTP